MEYKQFLPGPLLSAHVKCYWTLESGEEIMPTEREKIFPDGCTELIFHYGDLFKKHHNDRLFEYQPRSFLHGQLKQFAEIEASGKIGIFAVRFHPHGLHHFLNMDLHEITGQNVAPGDFWKKEGEVLEDKILHAAGARQRIEIIENFLLARLSKTKSRSDFTDYCVRQILQSNAAISIDKLAKDSGVSRRHLERKFITKVGLTPKLFSRIVRFQNAITRIEQGDFSNLTYLSLENGFYDQSHFIHDFKAFTGISPKLYFSEKLEFARHLIAE